MRSLSIFLGSRFAELRDVRKALKTRLEQDHRVRVVDLDDGQADPQSILERSLAHVRASDVVVVLLGASYGTPLPGHEKSITHLEYDAARASLKRKLIIPVLVGEQWADRSQIADKSLDEFAQQLHVAHTIAPPILRPLTDHAAICEGIALLVSNSLVTYLLGPSDDEVETSGLTALDADDSWWGHRSPIPFDQITLPAPKPGPRHRLADHDAAMARECEELGERETFVNLLRRSVNEVPLHFARTYWLARHLIAGRGAGVADGVKYASLAKALAPREAHEKQRSACSILLARGLGLLKHHDEAIRASEEAVRIAPWYPPARLELARHLLCGSPLRDESRAYDELREAFWIQPQALKAMYDDETFAGLRNRLDAQLREGLLKKIGRFRWVQRKLRGQPDGGVVERTEKAADAAAASVPELVWVARRVVLAQHLRLQKAARALRRLAPHGDPASLLRPSREAELAFYKARAAWLTFAAAVRLFETWCLESKVLAPHTSPKHARAGDLVVLDRLRDAAELRKATEALLPEDLAAAAGFAQVPLPEPLDAFLRAQEGRALYRSTGAELSRAAAYFD